MHLKFILFTIFVAAGFLREINTKTDYNAGWIPSRAHLPSRDSYTCLDGKRQSPVNLSDADATDGNFSSLVLSNYGNVWPFLNVNLELFAVSSQYYLSILKIHPLPYRPRLLMSGGGLRDEYELNEIFFRWPAEHTVYGKRYDLELQFSSFNTRFGRYAWAENRRGGLAFLSVFFEVTEYHTNDALWDKFFSTEFGRYYRNTNRYNRIVHLWTIADLLPEDLTSFYRYDGSLFYHNCSESVIWTVLTTPTPISKKQIERFKRFGNGFPRTEGSHRRQNPRNKRTIIYNTFRNDEYNMCGASWLTASLSLLATTMFMQLLLF